MGGGCATLGVARNGDMEWERRKGRGWVGLGEKQECQ